jgi:hypothetical protein
MAELKTKPTSASVSAFFAAIPDQQTRRDCKTLAALMRRASGAKPKMWGTAIVGFGDHHYVSPNTGRGGDWFQIGFSPRKAALTVYFMCSMKSVEKYLKKLGRHKTSKGCLYIKRLEDIDPRVLEDMLAGVCSSLSRPD